MTTFVPSAGGEPHESQGIHTLGDPHLIGQVERLGEIRGLLVGVDRRTVAGVVDRDLLAEGGTFVAIGDA